MTPEDPTNQNWLTLDDAASEFKVSRRTLERLRSKGTLPGIRAGRFLRVKRDDVLRALAFEDPIPLIRTLLFQPAGDSLDSWILGWSRYLYLTRPDENSRKNTQRWLDEIQARLPGGVIRDCTVQKVVEAAEASGASKQFPVMVDAFRGLSPNEPMQSILRLFMQSVNPQAYGTPPQKRT